MNVLILEQRAEEYKKVLARNSGCRDACGNRERTSVLYREGDVLLTIRISDGC